jgi:hypothetical protein
MYGRESTKPRSSQIAPAPQQASPATSGRASGNVDATTLRWFPIALVLAIALYVTWAVVEQHQRVKSAIEPRSIGINVRNIVVMLATVILGLNLFKIGAVKYSALTGGRFGGRFLVYLAGGA